ncbi:MAG: hypothetical protein L0I24_06275, partial [Pseudonocardia sp.]|nr:hypothetical protein [Pseudonocardia sp.]
MNEQTSTPDEQPDREPDRVDAEHGAPKPRSTVATDSHAAGGSRPAAAPDADPGVRPVEAPAGGASGAAPAGAVPVTGDDQPVVDVPTAPADAPTTQRRAPDSGNGHATGNGTAPGPVH